MSEVEFGGKSFSVDEIWVGSSPKEDVIHICFLPEIDVIVVIVECGPSLN